MSRSSAQRLFPLLVLLFAGSGCAALIYEIVWLQLLQLVIGSSAVSLGILLATFMGGMCAGSFLLPRLISTEHHPLRVYGLLEAGIGISAVAILAGLPLAGALYAKTVHAFHDIFLRGFLSAVFLLPPTILMGATFPTIARAVNGKEEGVPLLGYLYAGNIVGAVIGCVSSGFYFLRVHDLGTTTYVAVALNLSIAGIALWVSRKTPGKMWTRDEAFNRNLTSGPVAGKATAHVVIALSGFVALGAEVVWTRLLSLIFGATVYTFSLVLASFLISLGAGSFAGSTIARRVVRSDLALGICQLSTPIAIGWTAWAIAYSLPYWPKGSESLWSPWTNLALDLVRCFLAVLPAAFLWGASFPLALASVGSLEKDAGRLTGGVYAANTIGAINGALIFSMLVIPQLGSRHANQILIAVSIAAGLLIIRNRRTAALAAAFAGLIIWYVPPAPGLLVAYGRNVAKWVENPPEVIYVAEGTNSSVAVSEWPNGIRNFHVAGKVEASTQYSDMRLERLLGHLSALIHPKPRSVLVVGFGAGVTAGTFVLHPDVERIVICEIESLIPMVVSSYFSKENYDVVNDRRVEVVYDDARHYLLTTDEKFDIITSDPIHPWVKGAAALYTTEYFRMAASHLRAGGIISQWVPLYDSTEDVVKSEFATFFGVFSQGTVWSNDIKGRGYDVLLIGQNGPVTINLDSLADRLNRRDHQEVVTSLLEVGFSPAVSVFATYAGNGQQLKPWLENAFLNTDRNLRLQFLAGLAFNADEPDRIFQDFLAYRTFPEDLFVGSNASIETVRHAMAKEH